ncbi:hypothetical protein BASA62_009527 [Batrachochytrium salamandrivorans]|nr:hypothetical protein BASA62_009527 [Batrachochytrium salamandrivorans]
MDAPLASRWDYIWINALLWIDFSSRSPKKTLSQEDWEKKLSDVQISKQDLNKLVMNYLIIEGYKDAAEKFSAESGLVPSVDLATVEDRMNIRNAIQNGNIEAAIEQVNDLDPEILDTNPRLFFHLQRQKLIELIRNNRITEAIEFAQEELAPRGEENHSKIRSHHPVGDLLDNSQRQKTASELNAAILTAQCQEKDPKLPSLLKMLVWAQNQLDEKMVYPKIKNLVTAELEAMPSPSST